MSGKPRLCNKQMDPTLEVGHNIRRKNAVHEAAVFIQSSPRFRAEEKEEEEIMISIEMCDRIRFPATQ